jgi:MFS transporter, AAHS family, 4-hydroxybenzoate transporter
VTAGVLDPRTMLLEAPMSAYQKIGVTVTVALCMLDGFEVFAASFAAPAIKAAWAVNQAQIGMVLSSGLLGMAVGSLLIAPAADVIGRRRMLFLSLALMIVGDTCSANTHNVQALMLTRVFTGLGIGPMIAVISSLAAEYSNARRRDLCQTMFAAGFPLGGVLGGFYAAYLLPTYGWHALFFTAAALGLIMMLVVWLLLPEPIAPMIARPRADSLVRVNQYLKRCRMAPIAELPAPPLNAKSVPMKALFKAGMARPTILITSIYFLHVITLFFAQTWVPSMIAGEGFPPTRAALVGVWVNAGGIFGGLLLGATSMRFGLKMLVVTAMTGGAMLTAAFGSIPPNFLFLASGAAGMGFFLQGAMMGLYAVVARTFPAQMRVSGTGLVIGIGRIGSAAGPALAGQLLTNGLSRNLVAAAMGAPALLGALLLVKFRVSPPDIP